MMGHGWVVVDVNNAGRVGMQWQLQANVTADSDSATLSTSASSTPPPPKTAAAAVSTIAATVKSLSCRHKHRPRQQSHTGRTCRPQRKRCSSPTWSRGANRCEGPSKHTGAPGARTLRTEWQTDPDFSTDTCSRRAFLTSDLIKSCCNVCGGQSQAFAGEALGVSVGSGT